MEPSSKQQLWERWLRNYWEYRLEGVPAQLTSEEMQQMLDWLPDLDGDYPTAVLLARRFPPVHIQNNHLLYSFLDPENTIIKQFQSETAKLLIYLCSCPKKVYLSNELRSVASRLTNLPAELRNRLDEALLKL